MQELTLGNLDLRSFSALSSAAQLAGLRDLTLLRCWHFPNDADGDLHLLAQAPWITGLTRLHLEAER